jgi:hypothetical protein
VHREFQGFDPQDDALRRPKTRSRVNNKHYARVCAPVLSREFFLVDVRVLPEVLVGVVVGGPPASKPRFYASSAMLTL